MNLVEMLSYPVEEDGPEQMLIGGVLTLLSVAILPIFVVFGYYYEVMHSTINGGSSPPEFTTDNLARLTAKGVGVIGIAIVYGIVWVLLTVGILYFIQPYSSLDNLQLMPENSLLPALSVVFAGLITMILIGYMINASYVSYASTDNILSAFSPKKLLSIMLSFKFVIINTLLIFFGFISLTVFVVLTSIPFIGQLAAPFIQFPIFVIVWHALGAVGRETIHKPTTSTV